MDTEMDGAAEVERYPDCTVEILRYPDGRVSVGWWRNDQPPMMVHNNED